MASAVSATETRVKTSVDNVNQLSGTGLGDATVCGVDDTPMEDGDLGFLKSNNAYYSLAKESTVAADGIDVLLTNSARLSNTGPGRWIRMFELVFPPFLTVSDVFVNATTGNDQNNGLTANTALKTFAEFRKRIGTFNILNPVGGRLTVHILTDLPSTDPIGFEILLAPGATFLVQGVDKILLANVTANTIVNKDRATNTPWEITVNAFAANGWTPYVGKALDFLDSPVPHTKAYVVKDLGAKTAHISEFVVTEPFGNVPPNGIGFPPFFFGGAPLPGNVFNIVDYPTVTLGRMIVGWDPSKKIDFFDNRGGAVLRKLHVNSGGVAQEAMFPQVIGDTLTASTLSDCIVDDPIIVPGPNALSFATNCSFINIMTVLNAAKIIQIGGVFRKTGGGGNPCRIDVMADGQWLGELDPTFQGGGTSLFKITPLLIHGGRAEAGPISFWDQQTDGFAEMLNIEAQGIYISQPFGILFGDSGFEPFWGSGNNTTVPGQRFNIDEQALMLIGQVPGFTNPVPPLPSIEMDPNPVVFGLHRAPAPFGSVNAFSWDNASASFTGPVAFTWAGLNIAEPAGFQTDSSSFFGQTFTASSAQDPSVQSLLYRWSQF